MVGGEDVEWAYRLFLCREPDQAFVDSHRHANPDRHTLRDNFIKSNEFQSYLSDRGYVNAPMTRCVDREGKPFYVTGRFIRRISEYTLANPFESVAHVIGNRIDREDVIIDVGASIGIFSLFAARFVEGGGKVYAFEPHGATFEALKQTVVERDMSDVVSCVRSALGECNSYVNMAGALSPDGNGARTGPIGSERVPLRSLDAFSIVRRISAIKINTNGTEIDVLHGAQETVRKHRPMLIIKAENERHIREVFPDLDFEEISPAARAAGYIWLMPTSA